MSLLYVFYGVVWLIVSACQWRDLLRIQVIKCSYWIFPKDQLSCFNSRYTWFSAEQFLSLRTKSCAVTIQMKLVFSVILWLCLFLCWFSLFVCLVFLKNFNISSVIFSLLMSSSFSLKRGLGAKNKFGTVASHVDRPRKF